MGKSSKKSSVEVAPAAVSVPEGKSGKKGNALLSNGIILC
jgi:nucleolin